MTMAAAKEVVHRFGLAPFHSAATSEGIRVHVPPEYHFEHPTAAEAGDSVDVDPFGADADQDQSKSIKSESNDSLHRHGRLTIKLSGHEEVSSVAWTESETEGASNCSIHGTLYAMIQSSNSTSNAPFIVHLDDRAGNIAEVLPHALYSTIDKLTTDTDRPKRLVVHIPKRSNGFVPILHYKIFQHVEHMPILLERKITLQGKSCRVAAQVRSKLTNIGDMEDFTVTIAVPEQVDGASVHILRGQGVWNPTLRTIKFTLSALTQGESFMVSAEMRLWKPVAGNSAGCLSFPIVLRCSSIDDPISDITFHVKAEESAPYAMITSKTSAFRLLHRLA